jgi:hypothetical protein
LIIVNCYTFSEWDFIFFGRVCESSYPELGLILNRMNEIVPFTAPKLLLHLLCPRQLKHNTAIPGPH